MNPKIVSFALSALFIGAFSPSLAVAETPVSDCGTFITASGKYKVTSDITDCPGDPNFLGAITIFASDVHLDLDGHSITCLTTGLPDTGIVAAFVSDVKITNGSISGCDVGLVLFETSKSEVTGVTSNNNTIDPVFGGGFGILMDTGTENKLSGNTTNENDIDGIFVVLGSNNKISGNVANENFGPFGTATGIGLISSNDNVVVGNETNFNQGAGLVVRDFSTRNTIRGNSARNNGNAGIVAVGRADFGTPIAEGNLFQGNTALGHPFDLGEFFFDLNGNPQFFVEAPCRNAWKSNTFVSQLAPTEDCID